MSVTNMYAQDPTVVNRYLSGQLTDAERTAFEMELTRNPESLRELEATARLKVGLEKLREKGELLEELRREPVHRHPVFLALAATLAAVVIGVSLLRGNITRDTAPMLAATRSSFVDQQGSMLPVAETFALFRKRTDAFDAVVELPPTRQAIKFRVLPQGAVESERYRVSLARMRDDESLEREASVEQLPLDADGFISVFADASRLTPGRYRLAVSSEIRRNEPTPTDVFVIRVVSRSNN